MRYTASSPSVNSTRLRRSGILKMFASFSNIGPQCAPLRSEERAVLLGDDLGLAASLRDLFLRGRGELVSGDGELARKLTDAEHLHHTFARLENALVIEHLGGDGRLAQF